MKRYKILSLIICVIIGMALVSCGSDSSNEKPTIDEYGVCIDQEVDLGLPSGKIWAGWNIGATSPEEYGDYFSWGETQPKANYTFNSYMHTEYSPQTYNHDYVNIGCEISATKYDAAQYMWGSDWRMPTKTELEELVYECTWEDFEYKGVKGFLITGPNEVSMFLPAAGVKEMDLNWSVNFDASSLQYDGESGDYWCSTRSENYNGEAYKLRVSRRGLPEVAKYNRTRGIPIRPIKRIPVNESCIGEEVDLGLPSGTKWASWNVGATAPHEYGTCYAWGEVEEKNAPYTWDTYKYYENVNDTLQRCTDIGENISGTEYDVAHQKWGNGWRMPTKDEFDELCKECKWNWTLRNWINGYEVVGPNGNSIFLPVTFADGDMGAYSSASSAEDERSRWVCVFSGLYRISKIGSYLRYFPCSIRPVKTSEK